MKLVLAHGTFDGLHIGHVAYLKAARALGDMLVVGVTAASWVTKGDGRPIFSDTERVAMLKELRSVSHVVLVDEPGPWSLIEKFRPQIYAKGSEYQGKLPEQEMVERYGGQVAFIDAKPVYSSTRLLTGRELESRIRAARESVN